MDSQRKEVMPLGEAAAVDYGSEFVGEFFIYSVAIAVLTTEYYTSAKKAAAKEEAQQQRLAAMEENIAGLQRQLAQFEAAKSAEPRAGKSTLRAAADAAVSVFSVGSSGKSSASRNAGETQGEGRTSQANGTATDGARDRPATNA